MIIDFHTLSGLRKFLLTATPLKMMKNAFYSILKALFVLKIFRFLSWLFGHAGKCLDKKAHVNFKIYDVTDLRKQIVTIHIYPNISRSKGIKPMKFGQLTEHSVNIFLGKSYGKWSRETLLFTKTLHDIKASGLHLSFSAFQ